LAIAKKTNKFSKLLAKRKYIAGKKKKQAKAELNQTANCKLQLVVAKKHCKCLASLVLPSLAVLAELVLVVQQLSLEGIESSETTSR